MSYFAILFLRRHTRLCASRSQESLTCSWSQEAISLYYPGGQRSCCT